MPSPNNVGIDFDAKDYKGGREELEADVERLLAQHPELRATRRERTPSGGQHIYVRAADGMASWRKPSGSGHHCQFTTDESGAHRGEVLVGTRVCVTWPTPGYILMNPEHAHTFLEVPSLGAIGITPKSIRPKPSKPLVEVPPPQPSSVGGSPQLADLLGRMARDVLAGGRPYADDRSSNFSSFLKELYSVLNWLQADGLAFTGSADALTAQAIAALDIEDKANRVADGIDPAHYRLRDDDVVKRRKRYRYLSGERKPKAQRQGSQSSKQQPGEQSDQTPASWAALIQRLPDGWVPDGDTGAMRRSQLAVGKFAELLEDYKDWLRFNELTMFVEVLTSSGWRQVVDADMDGAYVLLSQKGWVIAVDPVTKGVCHVARQQSFHPVQRYLLELEQNAMVQPVNLDEVAPRFFRAADPLHVAMVRKWLVGAVARAMEPGCQMDYALVLQSRKQGLRKSTSFRDLASPDWFTSTVPDGDKDFLLNVHSCWIFELAELESVTGKRDAGRLKNLITTATDMFRVPYGRTAERRKRSSVFCGTVNEDTFLRDETGNRRYWVVPIEGDKPLDREGLKAARDGIWKAAIAAWRTGELPMLSRAQEALSEIQNSQFAQSDPWVEMVRAWMDGDPIHRWDRDRDPSTTPYDPNEPFSSAEVLYSAGLKRPDQITRADEMRVAAVLRQMGFEKGKQQRKGGRAVRLWQLAEPDQPSQPSQQSQPRSDEVVTPQTASAGMNLGQLSQPSQPLSSERSNGVVQPPPSVAAGNTHSPCVVEKVVTVVTPQPDHLRQQGSAPSHSPVTTPPQEVVTPLRASAVATCPWLIQLRQLRSEHPGETPHGLANLLQSVHSITTSGRDVARYLAQWDQQQDA